jgi:rubrerythrin
LADFHLDRFIELSGAVRLDDLDWEEARRAEITDSEERILRYMSATESYTILYMRDLLVGHSVRDPEITSFLSVWVYEELWHGRAIDKFLDAVGRPVAKDRFAQVASNVSFRELVETNLAAFAAYWTPKWIGTHMTWGAINELTAAAAYQRLEQTTSNPVLKILCNRLAKQERKHFAFYYSQAERRLKDDSFAQRLCRFILRTFWKPVGATVAGKEHLEFTAATLFADDNGKALLAEADKTIAELPGVAWFSMISPAVEKLVERELNRIARSSPSRTRRSEALDTGASRASLEEDERPEQRAG